MKPIAKVSILILMVLLSFGLFGCDIFGPNGGTNQAPVAVFTASPTSGDAPLDVSFDASNSYDPDGSIISYEWDFKDGSTGTGMTISHTFNSNGDYNVKLKVTDDQGVTDFTTKIISVGTSNVGSIKWTFPHGGLTSAIGIDGTIYVYEEGYLYAINPNGTLKWKFSTGGSLDSGPVIGADGTIYLVDNENLYAVTPSGLMEWKIMLEGASGLPTLGINTIFVDGYAVSLNGSLKWKFITGGVGPSVIGADGTIYFLGIDVKGWEMFAINPDGSQKWKFTISTELIQPISSASLLVIGADGTIYASPDHNIYAVNSNGSLKWKFSTGGKVGSPAIGADGTIYVGSRDGNFYAVNPDGTKKWQLDIDAYYFNPPVIGANGTIYVDSSSGFHAINPDGTRKWKLSSEALAIPTIGPDGTLYMATVDSLVAIWTESGGLANTPWPKFQHDLRNTGRAD